MNLRKGLPTDMIFKFGKKTKKERDRDRPLDDRENVK